MTRVRLLVLLAFFWPNTTPDGNPVFGAVTVTFPVNPPRWLMTTRGKMLLPSVAVIDGALKLIEKSCPVTVKVSVDE